MMEKLFKQMMEEKHDFYHYMGLYEMCSDPAIKAKLHAIASQEVQHYKEIYDIINYIMEVVYEEEIIFSSFVLGMYS